MTTGMTNAYDWRGRVLIGRDGEKIGKIDEIYVDRRSEEPEWARVTTGLFGTRASFVPLVGAQPHGEQVAVTATKDEVKDAPHLESDGELSEQEEAELFRHYGIDYTGRGSITWVQDGVREGGLRTEADDAAGGAR